MFMNYLIIYPPLSKGKKEKRKEICVKSSETTKVIVDSKRQEHKVHYKLLTGCICKFHMRKAGFFCSLSVQIVGAIFQHGDL